MSKLFYDHFIVIEEITTVLDKHELPKKEREELLTAIHETFDHQVLDVILSHLPSKHHESFLESLTTDPRSPKLLDFVREHATSDIEKEILIVVSKIKKKILRDIRQVQDNLLR